MSVHYKFKSGKDAHTVTFDGLHISVADLKKAIMQQRKIGKSSDLDLQITNAQTKEVYETDASLIPKNTSVIVARVPNSGNQKKNWDKHDMNSTKGANSPSHVELDKITKSSNLSTSYASEDEKIKAMMSQSTQEYDPSKYVKNRGIVGPLPSNYTCYRCGQQGHYIKQCPTNNSDVKRSTGIPRSFMIPASADQKGALLTASGEYAVPIIDHEAYKEVKKEKPPFLPNSESDKESIVPEIPDDLKCTLCLDLLQDAVLIPCCGNSYCDECVRTILLESENHECPTCHETSVSPDTLIPNRYLRLSVTKFKNDTGYSRGKYVPNSNDINVDSKQLEIETVNSKVDESSINSDELESKDVTPQPSPHTSDVTMDEVILGSPKVKSVLKIDSDINVASSEPPIETFILTSGVIETNENDESNDSRAETALNTGSNTPLVDEPPDSYETNDDHLNEPNETNSVITTHLSQYAQPLLSVQAFRQTQRINVNGPMRNPRQPNQTLIARPPILSSPQQRNMYPRHAIGQDTRYYRPPNYPLVAPMPPYGFQTPMRAPTYHDPYGYMGPRSHMGPAGPAMHPMGLHQSMSEAPPPGATSMMSDGIYSYTKQDYDDYEDRVQRFTRQLESRPTRRPKRRSASRSRSRSHSRSSSSGSSSSSSSTSSRSSRFSFSSRSFSGSSRSRSFSPRRRSRSRSHYRRRSRSKSPRHGYGRDYRYRRSRSPYHHESSRRYGRPARRPYESERDREHRNVGRSRYDRSDNSYRSSRRSRERKDKDVKPSHSSHCNNKSRERTRNRDKQSEARDATQRRRSKTPLKDETESKPIVKSENVEPVNELETESNVIKPERENSNTNINSDIKDDNDKKEKKVNISSENKDVTAVRTANSEANERKREKEKARRHHRHHHHHHHRRRKASDDSKYDKASDESKASAKKRHKHKRHKHSDTSRTVKEVQSTDLPVKEETDSGVKLEEETHSECVENLCDTSAEKFAIESELQPIQEEDKSYSSNDSVDDKDNIADKDDVNESEVLVECKDNEVVIKEDNLEITENNIERVVSDADFGTDKSTLITNVENELNDESVKNSEENANNNRTHVIQLVDYTDNEDLVEANNDNAKNNANLESSENDNNNNCSFDDYAMKAEDINPVETLIAPLVYASDSAVIPIEIPKSKWDDDYTDIRFEEEYSDFEEQKADYEALESNKNACDSKLEKSLPNDIIQKAEKVILEKQLRPVIIEKKDRNSSDKKVKTAKNDDREKSKEVDSCDRSKESDRVKRDKDGESERNRSKERKDKERDHREKSKDVNRDRNEKRGHSSGKTQSKSAERSLPADQSAKDVESNDSADNHPRKVKLDRSKFAEKPTLSITIDNSEKEKNSKSQSRRDRDRETNSKSSTSGRHKSSRDRSKERSRRDIKERKEEKKGDSSTARSRDQSRQRYPKRGRRSRSRSTSSHKKSKTRADDDRKSKAKSRASSSSKKSK